MIELKTFADIENSAMDDAIIQQVANPNCIFNYDYELVYSNEYAKVTVGSGTYYGMIGGRYFVGTSETIDVESTNTWLGIELDCSNEEISIVALDDAPEVNNPISKNVEGGIIYMKLADIVVNSSPSSVTVTNNRYLSPYLIYPYLSKEGATNTVICEGHITNYATDLYFTIPLSRGFDFYRDLKLNDSIEFTYLLRVIQRQSLGAAYGTILIYSPVSDFKVYIKSMTLTPSGIRVMINIGTYNSQTKKSSYHDFVANTPINNVPITVELSQGLLGYTRNDKSIYMN